VFEGGTGAVGGEGAAALKGIVTQARR